MGSYLNAIREKSGWGRPSTAHDQNPLLDALRPNRGHALTVSVWCRILLTDVRWQQASIVVIASRVRKPFQQESQISVRFQPASLRGFDQSKVGGGRMGSVGMTSKEPILAAHGEGAETAREKSLSLVRCYSPPAHF